MTTRAQQQIKELIDTLKWADGMFTAGATSGDVDIEAITAETTRVLEARRADVLCPAKDRNGRRCMLARAHDSSMNATPHEFDTRRSYRASSRDDSTPAPPTPDSGRGVK